MGKIILQHLLPGRRSIWPNSDRLFRYETQWDEMHVCRAGTEPGIRELGIGGTPYIVL